jgi:heme-degrading monooxygenase HmoA
VVQFVWEFIARADKIDDFERHYAASGSWADLFRRSAGYQSTQLLRDAENPRRYLTIDRWDSLASYRAMRHRFEKEHDALDRACEAFTESEHRIGVFEEA